MFGYSRFPTTHTVAACVIAVPLTSLLLAGNGESHNAAAADPAQQISIDALPTPPVHVPEVALASIPEPDSAATAAAPLQVRRATDVQTRVETIRPGDSLARVFQRVAVPPSDLASVLQSGKLAAGLQRIYPGQRLTFTKTSDGHLQELVYSPSPLQRVVFERNADHFTAKKIDREPEVITNYRHGVIKHSLFAAGQRIGLNDEIIQRLAQIFQWDIDFVLDIRSGDDFSLLFEDLYVDGNLISHGRILAAEFNNQGTRYRAVYYQDRTGRGDYYSPSGESMRKAFLRAPVEFKRISSNYNPRRFHPIQKRIMPHRGIDYAAPYGTPVLASGDGRVVTASRTTPNGNYVVLQHGEQFQTKYLHLSKFGRGIRSGARIKQGQIIGYVGATGWATAPHLHYEFLVNGVHQNPRTVPLPKAQPVASAERARFAAVADELIARIDAPDAGKIRPVRLDGERVSAATGG